MSFKDRFNPCLWVEQVLDNYKFVLMMLYSQSLRDGMQLMARHRLIMLVVFVFVVLYVVRLVNICLKVVLL